MLKKKSSNADKKRKHSKSVERRDNKRRSAETHVEHDCKDELADPELDRIGSDIEDGGLDLSLPFKPITAFIDEKREMLEQCFHVLGEKKLMKMLPDELKDCSLEEIKKLCWEQLEPISEKNLTQILTGEEVTPEDVHKNTEQSLENQQDNNVDSTSCLKETAKTGDPKQEGGGSGEESDVLSINADTYDSDIEGPKEEQTAGAVEGAEKVSDRGGPDLSTPDSVASKKDIQTDIDKSVSEILMLTSNLSKSVSEEGRNVHPQSTEAGSLALSRSPGECPPSLQQLELLELEMRARAIKALMKANTGKKMELTKNM